MTTLKIELPPKIVDVFSHERGSVRYRVLVGGRGSAKSFSVAKMVAIWGAIEPLRILCTREFQNSIKESMHAEIKNAIASCAWLSSQYSVGVDYIRHVRNGGEFLFRGLRHNIENVKSMAQIDVCVVEEAETVPKESWQALLPTIRASKSEIIIIFNPKRKDSWVAQTFLTGNPPPRSIIKELNWRDNPWFPMELEEQRKDAQERLDPALYAHIWEGAFYEQSQAQIFSGKFRYGEFESQPDWDGPYFGLDFGFSQDETAAVQAWVHDNTLYIEHEIYEKHLEIDDTASLLIKTMPTIAAHTIRADNARPESISYLKRNGLPRMESCKKGAGSVEDGVEFIKTFKQVVIHERCKNTYNEFSLYSYKIDRHSGDILPTITDAYNHAIDALRYALEPIMRKTRGFFS